MLSLNSHAITANEENGGNDGMIILASKSDEILDDDGKERDLQSRILSCT